MHRKKISTALILLLFTLTAHAAKKPAGVRENADKDFADLKKQLAGEKDQEERFKLLHNFESKVTDLRAANKRQNEDDEIYLDQLTEGLKMIPRDTKLKDTCETQRTAILFAFEPTAQDKKPKQPGVAKAIEALDLVGKCSLNAKK